MLIIGSFTICASICLYCCNGDRVSSIIPALHRDSQSALGNIQDTPHQISGLRVLCLQNFRYPFPEDVQRNPYNRKDNEGHPGFSRN